jgi:hypothetical protein
VRQSGGSMVAQGFCAGEEEREAWLGFGWRERGGCSVGGGRGCLKEGAGILVCGPLDTRASVTARIAG